MFQLGNSADADVQSRRHVVTHKILKNDPDFAVQLNLGMTPVSLSLHSVLEHMPGLLAYFDARSSRSKFARDLVQLYYYVSGVKDALKDHRIG